MSHSVLIIGCGSIGERHLRCFLATGRATATACDTNPALLARIAETYKVPTSSDWEKEMASGKYDCAVICTPAPFHVGMAIKLLKSGVNVLIEKPLSISLQDVDALIEARNKSGKEASVAYVIQLFPVLREVREFLLSGAIGPVLQATVVSGQPFHLLRPAYAKTYYRDRKMGGGAIQDALTHTANWVQTVLGPADSVLCDAGHQCLPEVEVEDTVHISARHGSAMASYALNQFQASNDTRIEFHSATASVRIEIPPQKWGVFRTGDTDWTWKQPAPLERDALFTAQADRFLDQVDGKPAILCSLETAADSLRFNLASLASLKDNARVRLEDIHA